MIDPNEIETTPNRFDKLAPYFIFTGLVLVILSPYIINYFTK